jgi:hypothetical protein
MKEGRPPKIDFQNNRFAVRDSARYASARDRVLEEHISQRPETSAQLERMKSQGLDPTAWLNVISVRARYPEVKSNRGGEIPEEQGPLQEEVQKVRQRYAPQNSRSRT